MSKNQKPTTPSQTGTPPAAPPKAPPAAEYQLTIRSLSDGDACAAALVEAMIGKKRTEDALQQVMAENARLSTYVTELEERLKPAEEPEKPKPEAPVSA